MNRSILGLDFGTSNSALSLNVNGNVTMVDIDKYKRVKQVEAELYQLAVELGGTLTGEHGVGMSKAKYMTLEHDPVFIRVMNGLKNLFDPNAILNPGKLGLDV